MEEADLDFNFWPSFADLMLALVLILVLVIFSVTVILKAGSINLSEVKEKQTNIINELAISFSTKPIPINENDSGISTTNSSISDIIFHNELTLQRITFSDRILFQPDEHRLNENGKIILAKVGEVLRRQLSSIREIQIQGHADTDITSHYRSNTELAAQRAIEVFSFLQNQVGIDPAEHLMSATSFGEYRPAQRGQDDMTYNKENLREHNNSTELKRQNRRIELLLLYRK
jgi:outer membrane protein OmpA-like peptidoglycan-associated protein